MLAEQLTPSPPLLFESPPESEHYEPSFDSINEELPNSLTPSHFEDSFILTVSHAIEKLRDQKIKETLDPQSPESDQRWQDLWESEQLYRLDLDRAIITYQERKKEQPISLENRYAAEAFEPPPSLYEEMGFILNEETGVLTGTADYVLASRHFPEAIAIWEKGLNLTSEQTITYEVELTPHPNGEHRISKVTFLVHEKEHEFEEAENPTFKSTYRLVGDTLFFFPESGGEWKEDTNGDNDFTERIFALLEGGKDFDEIIYAHLVGNTYLLVRTIFEVEEIDGERVVTVSYQTIDEAEAAEMREQFLLDGYLDVEIVGMEVGDALAENVFGTPAVFEGNEEEDIELIQREKNNITVVSAKEVPLVTENLEEDALPEIISPTRQEEGRKELVENTFVTETIAYQEEAPSVQATPESIPVLKYDYIPNTSKAEISISPSVFRYTVKALPEKKVAQPISLEVVPLSFSRPENPFETPVVFQKTTELSPLTIVAFREISRPSFVIEAQASVEERDHPQEEKYPVFPKSSPPEKSVVINSTPLLEKSQPIPQVPLSSQEIVMMGEKKEPVAFTPPSPEPQPLPPLRINEVFSVPIKETRQESLATRKTEQETKQQVIDSIPKEPSKKETFQQNISLTTPTSSKESSPPVRRRIEVTQEQQRTNAEIYRKAEKPEFVSKQRSSGTSNPAAASQVAPTEPPTTPNTGSPAIISQINTVPTATPSISDRRRSQNRRQTSQQQTIQALQAESNQDIITPNGARISGVDLLPSFLKQRAITEASRLQSSQPTRQLYEIEQQAGQYYLQVGGIRHPLTSPILSFA